VNFRTAVSLRSRAARRGEEPPAKDLVAKKTAAPAEETDYKPWLHSAQNAGISKKPKAKQLTRQQKVRQQKALEKADANVDKLERKVADSKARAKRVKARAKEWEELNVEAGEKAEKGSEQAPAATVAKEAKGSGEEEERGMEDVQLLGSEQPLSTKKPDGVIASETQLVQSAPAAAVAAVDLDEVT